MVYLKSLKVHLVSCPSLKSQGPISPCLPQGWSSRVRFKLCPLSLVRFKLCPLSLVQIIEELSASLSLPQSLSLSDRPSPFVDLNDWACNTFGDLGIVQSVVDPALALVQYEMPSRMAQIRLVSSHPEVYEPCDDSFALVDALLADRINLIEHHPRLCMEVGCGSGYVITSLALMLGQEVPGVHFIATDINPHAVRVTYETLGAHGVHAELICTNIASGLETRLAGSVDVMVVNPPYVPTPEDEVGREGIASAWAGGENGRSVIDKILPIADNLLSERGWLYLVTLTTNNPSDICLQMRQKGYAARIVVQRSTEEESLHIIKFWRDLDTQVDAKETVTMNKTVPMRVLESLVSQFPSLSLWRSGNNDCSS